MALQMTGSAPQVLLGPCDADSLHPDLQWLQQQLQDRGPLRWLSLSTPATQQVCQLYACYYPVYAQHQC
jgi:hypothetical protein